MVQPYEVRDAGVQRKGGTKGPLWHRLSAPPQGLHYHDRHGRLPGPLWTQKPASSKTPSLDHLATGLDGQGWLHYNANPRSLPLIWRCVCPLGRLISASFHVSKAPDSSPRIILALLTSLKCESWFEKVLTSTICYFSLNNLHFKVNMAFIAEWISVCCLISHKHEKDAGFLLNKNVFIRQMTSKTEFLF